MGFEIPVIEPLVAFGFTVFVDVPVRAVIGAVDNDCEQNIYFFCPVKINDSPMYILIWWWHYPQEPLLAN